MSGRIAFPPIPHHVEMPASGRRAQRAALALFAATEPSQRVAMRGMRLLISLGATRPLRTAPVSPPLPSEQWDAWIHDVATAHVGPVADVAWFVGRPERLAGLLLHSDGAPLAFMKFSWGSWVPGAEEAAASAALFAPPAPASFSVPGRIAQGYVEAVHWQLDEPLPEGPHHRPSPDVRRLRSVMDELRERLDGVPLPPDATPDAVLTHGDFTPRNLRQTAEGRLWLLDWEGASWGPAAADELSYWLVHCCTTLGHRPRRDAKRIQALVAGRHTDDEVRATLRWLDDRMGADSFQVRRALHELVSPSDPR